MIRQHKDVPAACAAMDTAWKKMLSINWPSGLAGAGSAGAVKPGAKWTVDPQTRL